MNGLRCTNRPFVEVDDRFIRGMRHEVRNGHQGCDQTVFPVGILREDLHDVAVGLAIQKLEGILAGREHLSGDLHRRAELKFDFLVPLIGVCGLPQKRP